MSNRIPRDPINDYAEAPAAKRREFVADQTGVTLKHVAHYSVDPAQTAGNIENFIGVAQVPMGLVGPLRVNGEHASGVFYVPMATSEGTLVASYNRGARLLSESGGATVTVVDDAMQRAPVFVFDDARQARAFGLWVEANFAQIAAQAESSTSIGKLRNIEQYAAARMRYLRFNYTTGDAAGQNMVGKATFVACEWIRKNHPLKPEYILSGAIDTDKKHSAMNMIRTRGKRVIAEFTLKKEVARELLRVDPKDLYRYRQIAAVGAIQSGAAYSGAHSANGIAALFIATGQDEANVAESHAGITYGQLLDNGDYYWSVTLPAIICATYGGGTGLPAQRECLEMLDCYGAGKADKFAEIVAAVVLAGDVSLTSAVLSGDWVTSHETHGRNR